MSTSLPPIDHWPPADPPLPLPPRGMSEDEFERWAFSQEDIRAEWVDGEVVVMSPVNRKHSALFHWVIRLLGDYIEERKLGELFGPDFMARLGKQRRRRLPDLMFVAASRGHIVKPTYLDGPPDMAIEIVSPDSRERDWQDKYADFEQAAVREYWIIDQDATRLEAFHLAADQRFAPIAERDGKILSQVVPGWYLRKEWLWNEPRPTVSQILRELQGQTQ